jgi:hypothetical protein
MCEGSDYIIGFVTRHFYHLDAISREKVFDYGNCPADVFWRFIARGFIFWKLFVTKSAAWRIKGDGYEVRIFRTEEFFEGIDKTESG